MVSSPLERVTDSGVTRRIVVLLVAGLLIVGAGCGDGDGDSDVVEGDGGGDVAADGAVDDGGADGEAEPTESPAPTQVTLVAESISFDRDTITVTAGEEVTITYENRDDGITHNLRVFGPDEEFATEVAAGPVTQTLTFTIDEPGSYEFQCDIHPAQMSGTLIVV